MRCSATTKAGRPCKGHAIRGSEPPLCPVHARSGASRERQEPATPGAPGFYGRNFTVGEIADLLDSVEEKALADEIDAVRITTRRIMEQFSDTLEPAEYRQLARLVFAGANTIARLLQARRALSAASADDVAAAIAGALDELSQEMGISL
jgi:hypothetical protein